MSERRFEGAGRKRMMRRRWNGRVQGNDAGRKHRGCSAVGSAGAGGLGLFAVIPQQRSR